MSALRAELGLSRARAEDDKALEQARYDSELVQARAAFEAEKREILLESEKNDAIWRTEFLRFKNEVLYASQSIREQARLDGDELRPRQAEKDRANSLVERVDAALEIRILEGEAHESNIIMNMLTDMNGELQSDLKKMAEPSELLSREELQSERKVLEETATGLVSGHSSWCNEVT
ncbi:hypothetical protein DYB37_012845 [Aphanomyces astaci]|uniref:Uncharacterized protein n=1 Tax=Aphanomyces astaci TaxID=112090 RepID=A0A3R6ZI95_APHAT|nr:hypothetical protein DYB35_010252 [Aphanomyces astaci]RHZ31882.1 hypothetical protein DYB37_012845 [Aphanomyces astaci]